MATLTDFSSINEILGINPYLLAVILVWTLIWKGLALWRASKKDHKIWFVILLVVNTVGILEILYLFLFSKLDLERKTRDARKRKK